MDEEGRLHLWTPTPPLTHFNMEINVLFLGHQIDPRGENNSELEQLTAPGPPSFHSPPGSLAKLQMCAPAYILFQDKETQSIKNEGGLATPLSRFQLIRQTSSDLKSTALQHRSKEKHNRT